MFDNDKAALQLDFRPHHSAPEQLTNALYVLVQGGELASGSSENFDCLWGASEYAELKTLGWFDDATSKHFLGFVGQQPCWVVTTAKPLAAGLLNCQWRPLLHCLGEYPDPVFNLLGRGVQLLNWYRNHQFCGRCGSGTSRVDNECAAQCQHCQEMFYPRLSPCAIVLITRGDYCLLARNVAWNAEHFSPVAGFIEAGETAEGAASREAFEEVGINVGQLRYFGSQPWPFPGQLMLGFFADYESGEIVPDGIEIAEAKWFKYDNLPRKFYPGTLSARLVAQFAKDRAALTKV